MKKIIFVRHAKSIPFDYNKDYDRVLTERGERDAGIISLELQKIGISPDLIIASPAVRTIQTAQIFAKALGYPKEKIQYDKRYYSGLTSENLLHDLKALNDEQNTVMIVGHNPSIYYYMHYLISDFYEDVPTCTTVGVDFNTDHWNELKQNGGTMTFRFIPDQFRS